MSARRLWWTSFGRAALGAALVIGAVAALASVLEVYFFAIVVAVFTLLYRREILAARAPEPLPVVSEAGAVGPPPIDPGSRAAADAHGPPD